jgi:RND family efflux transporter MFP subunit
VRITLVWISLVGAIGAACAAPPKPAARTASPVAAEIGTATMTDLPSSFEAGGIVRARATAAIASRVMAVVTAVNVRAGDRVRAGAPLVTLDARELTAARAQAGAALTSATEAARAADADAASADAACRLARATHDRIESLYAKRSATAQELDQAVATLGAADAQLAGARSRAAAANAARDAARAGAEASRVGASYAILSAPFDGAIAERNVEPGSMATPGVPLLVLEDTRRFRLEVQIDEARASSVRAGQTVETRVGDRTSANEPWSAGPVSEIARLDPATHSLLVKIDLPQDSARGSGQFGRARFPGVTRRVLAIPASAIIRRGQLTLVFTVDPEGIATLRPIVTGPAGADHVEVLAGLRAGDRVVLSPPIALTDGSKVTGAGQ